MDKNAQFLLGNLDAVAVLIVVLIGIIAALVRFKYLGKAAIIAILGFLTIGLGTVFGIVYHAWATYIYVPGNSEVFELVFWTRTVLSGICTVLGLILLIAAIVIRRPDSGRAA